MSNISIKLNLAQLKHAERDIKGKSGNKVKCLVIPILENKLFQGEKGVYLDLIGFEIKNKSNDSKDTHLVKQSFQKEVYEVMSEDQKRAMPVIGNLIVWERQEPDSQLSNEISDLDNDEVDDLPF